MYVYCRTLGGTTLPVAPHLCLIGLLVGAAYGHAFMLAKIEPAWLRRTALAGLSFVTYGTLAIFYAVTIVCLYGFRDLPTRQMVLGYLEEVPSLIRALPIDRAMVLLVAGAATAALVGMVLVVAWCFEGLGVMAKSSPGRRTPSAVVRLALQLGAPIAFVSLLLMPSRYRWFLDNLEPMTRSIRGGNEALLVRRVQVQALGVGTSRDPELESLYPVNPLGNRRNVILIVIDAMRADVLQSYGGPVSDMPFIDSLVKVGIVRQYPHVFSSCSFTLCGMGSLFGSRPAHRILPDDFGLPTVLKKQGYDLRYLLSGDHQHYLNVKAYYGKGIDFYRDGKDIDPQRSTNDIVVFGQLSQLPSARSVARPQFMVLLLNSVHALGQRNPEFRRALPDKMTIADIAHFARKSVEVYRNNYQNGVLQADWVLNQIWNWLGTNGYLENSVIVITGDHGESLGEHGILGHGRSLQNPELQIPLWIHEPSGQLPTRDFVFQTDIAPTILDLLELPIPASWEGASLLRKQPNEWNPIYLMNGGSQFGLIRYQDGQITKYLLDTLFGYERVYDLNADLAEDHDLVASIPPTTLNEFRQEMRKEFGTLLPNAYP